MSETNKAQEVQPVSWGELSVGDHITVLQWEEPPNPFEHMEKHGFIPMMPKPMPKDDFVGDVLRVEAINLPFVLIQNVSDYTNGFIMMTIDLRLLKIRMVTEDFARAVSENVEFVKLEHKRLRDEAMDYHKTIVAGGTSGNLANVLRNIPVLNMEQFFPVDEEDFEDEDEDDIEE